MNPRFLSSSAALVLGAALCALPMAAQNQAAQSSSPFGGTVVEQIIARVNDQIITQTDYDTALQQLDNEGRQRGETMQEMADARRNLLRDLIDQQLWLSKGKELGITGDTELIKRLDDIRKQYHLASLEDLQKAAEEQGVSYADFKQNIRNQIITQDVMRQEVGSRIQITPGQARQYYEEHKQDFQQPESIHLSEILISTGAAGANGQDDPAKVAEAKAKADDIEARLNSGGDFAELARRFSNGPTAASGGDLGQFRRGALAKVLEEKTFSLNAGQWTQPIRTRQGWIILKVTQHTPAGVQPFNQVEDQVDQALYMSLMEPAIRAYLTKMREEAFIDIKSGYEDSGASPNETKPVFSAYVPPSPKKRAKVERVRYRENTRGFRSKTEKKKDGKIQKPGKKEKIRFGQAPLETLPTATDESSNTVNAGALPESANAAEPPNPLEPVVQEKKTRFSDRARYERSRKNKKKKSKAPAANPMTPAPPDAAEVANRQAQSAPLGLSGDTSKKKEKHATTTGEKTRYSETGRNAPKAPEPVPQMTIAPPVAGAPAPARQPAQPQNQDQPQNQQQ